MMPLTNAPDTGECPPELSGHMQIRQALPAQLPEIMNIYAQARAYMAAHGNPSQWKDGYPARELVQRDLENGCCMVCMEDGQILGVFSCLPGPDPTYLDIEDGAWPDDRPYGVIHRISVRAHQKGVASFCFAYGLRRFGVLRIDTHRDNLPMQKALAKNGFARCGVIHLENGEERIAYQKG